jgi:hypothetical protein
MSEKSKEIRFQNRWKDWNDLGPSAYALYSGYPYAPIELVAVYPTILDAMHGLAPGSKWYVFDGRREPVTFGMNQDPYFIKKIKL